MSLWMRNGAIVGNSLGQPIDCQDCPCGEEGSGSGSGGPTPPATSCPTDCSGCSLSQVVLSATGFSPVTETMSGGGSPCEFNSTTGTIDVEILCSVVAGETVWTLTADANGVFGGNVRQGVAFGFGDACPPPGSYNLVATAGNTAALATVVLS